MNNENSENSGNNLNNENNEKNNKTNHNNQNNQNNQNFSSNSTTSKCPFKHTLNNTSKQMKLPEEILKEAQPNPDEVVLKKSCPYAGMNYEDLLKTEEDFAREENYSSCPIMNKIPIELNTKFDFYFEIPFYDKNDFYFNIRGILDDIEFKEKTSKFRSLPRHLKYTLFHLKEEKVRNVREKEFTHIYFVYEDLREKAIKLYNQKKFRQSIAYFTFAYSLFKWLEFKDPERTIKNVDKFEPILDEQIEIKCCKLDQNFSYEEATFKGCLVSILKSLCSAYMHLRHFSEAIKCINEAIEYSDNKVPELYLRRSQARMFNKHSDFDKLKLALNDILKAKEMKKEEPRFDESLIQLKQYMDDKQMKEGDRVLKLISNATFSFNKIKEKNLDIENNVYYSYDSVETNQLTLEEMRKSYKYAIKFHTEMSNQKQIDIAYREYEEFMNVYTKFNWYFNFELSKIPKPLYDSMNEEERFLLNHPKFQRLIKDFKLRTAEEVFSKADFNFQILKHSVDKVIEEQKIKQEIDKKYGDEFGVTKWKIDFSFKNKNSLRLLFSFIVLISFIVIFIHYLGYSKTKKDYFNE